MNNSRFRYILIAAAILITAATIVTTNSFVEALSKEERRKMEIWAEATNRMLNDEYNDFIFKIIEDNENIPVIIADEDDRYISARNFKEPKQDVEAFYARKIAQLKEKNPPIEIKIDENERQYIYYDDSLMLKRLAYFPYIQFSVVALFLAAAFWAFATSKRSEQNKLWVGLSKETAHQLGTPITSLFAWIEILKMKYPEEQLIPDINKDIERLRTIADRFSKIGSKPSLTATNLPDTVQATIRYMERRTSKGIRYSMTCADPETYAMLCPPLFEWVIENLCKNAIDAMERDGSISVDITKSNGNVYIDVTDTGKGIERKKFKTIFQPGFTTKKRGWGLGLALTKRIIEEYHDGRIFVKQSEISIGTTFRIILPEVTA